jgi:hypothetical protein
MEYLLKIYERDDEEETRGAAVVTMTAASLYAIQSDCAKESSPWRGRSRGSRPNIQRRPCSWESDYLSINPAYPPWMFRLVFRIPLKLYYLLKKEVPEEEPRILKLRDSLGRLGHTADQKLLVCFRRLANAVSFFAAGRSCTNVSGVVTPSVWNVPQCCQK